MTQTTRSPVLRLEKQFSLQDKLTGAGYQSVFDIVRLSRSQFIKKHRPAWGRKSAKVYDHAIGFANQLTRLFRSNKVALTLEKQNTRNTSGNLQGLHKNGPTWQSLFQDSWDSYCLSNAPEANQSPVSYLSWLYNQAQDFESQMNSSGIIPLATRRPDLPNLMLDDNAINQVIPSLQLVNEVLEASVEPYVGDDTTVDETLSATRYPSMLPYHYPHQQALLSLENDNESLQNIIKKTDTAWPYFVHDDLLAGNATTACQLGSNLAPEQMTILTEPDNSTASDLTTFYLENFGLSTADYTPFADVDELCKQLGVTAQQLEKMLASSGGQTTVVASPNYPVSAVISSADYGATFINNDNSHPISLYRWEGEILYGNPELVDDVDYGSAVELDGSKNQYVKIPDFFTTASSQKNNFSMGFWINIHSSPNGDIMIGGNTEICSSGRAADNGVFILGGSGKFDLNITDSNGVYVHNNSIPYATDEWNYFIFSVNWDTGNVDICKRTRGSGKTTVTANMKLSSLSGDLPVLKYWYMNNDNGENYYSRMKRSAVIDIDDLAVWSFALSPEEMADIAASTLPAGGRNDMQQYYSFSDTTKPVFISTVSNLSDARMDRINRIARLQRWLGLPFDQVDLLLSGTLPDSQQTNANSLRMVAVLNHYQQNDNVNALQFAAVLNQITPYALAPDVPFFDQVFNSPSLFEEPFAITNMDFNYTAQTGTDGRIVRQLCAGLDINDAQFLLLAGAVAEQQGNVANHTLNCSLDVVSAFYRLVMVPRWLGFSFNDGLALLKMVENGKALQKLAAIPVYAELDENGQQTSSDILDTLMALADAAQWLQDNNLSALKVLAMIQEESDIIMPATTAELNFVKDINQQLPATLLSEQSFANVPFPESIWSIQGGSTAVDSPLGVGHGYMLDSTKKQFVTLCPGANALAVGNQNYTLGTWVKIANGASVDFPLMANADTYSSIYSPGIFIATGSGYHLNISVVVAGGTTDDLNTNTSDTTWQSDHWYWLAVTTDVVNKSVTVYCYSEDGSIKTSAALTYTGSILPSEENVWAVNQSGSLNNSFKATVSYDDVTLWDCVLTEEQIAAIVSSGKSATQNIPARFSTSTINEWLPVLTDLVDSSGLILPSATDYNTVVAMVSADLDAAGIPFSSDTNKEQAVNSITSIILQAKQNQGSIANSSLAKALNTDHSLPPFLLQWADSSDYDLLSQSLAMKDIISPDDIIPDYLQLLYQLAQRAGFVNTFGLTSAMLNSFLQHTTWFGVEDSALSFNLTYLFSRYADWLKLTPKEDTVLAYLRWVNADAAPATDKAASVLAELLNWDSSEVQQAAAHAAENGLAQTLPQVDTVMRLKTLSTNIGASVESTITIGNLITTSIYDDWQSVGESLVAAQANP